MYKAISTCVWLHPIQPESTASWALSADFMAAASSEPRKLLTALALKAKARMLLGCRHSQADEAQPRHAREDIGASKCGDKLGVQLQPQSLPRK